MLENSAVFFNDFFKKKTFRNVGLKKKLYILYSLEDPFMSKSKAAD